MQSSIGYLQANLGSILTTIGYLQSTIASIQNDQTEESFQDSVRGFRNEMNSMWRMIDQFHPLPSQYLSLYEGLGDLRIQLNTLATDIESVVSEEEY